MSRWMAAKTCTGLAMGRLTQCNDLKKEEEESSPAVPKVSVIVGISIEPRDSAFQQCIGLGFFYAKSEKKIQGFPHVFYIEKFQNSLIL
jgi:hypothetical protein